MPKPLIYCAIDTGDLDHAITLSKAISPHCGIKLGMEFFNAFGPQGIETVLESAPDASLFIDLKYHDIPNTVAGAVRSICTHFAPDYLNVHASGGRAMMEAAQNACESISKGKTSLLAVTILTSLEEQDLREIGYQGNTAEQVKNMAQLTQASGLAGVVCSSHEIAMLRDACGTDFVLMVPGIRAQGNAQGDQKRVMSPPEAVQLGATHLVIGRPITQSADPGKTAQEIMKALT
ncbi:MAG: orotidine-5'-phosphate decarboxylase [Alphaproteobacteria bacterium]